MLFTYREVAQASTGFSPFELVYGRDVRRPLDVKESWDTDKRSTESVVSYILTIQEWLTKLRDVVRENLEDAQAPQKTWYDCHARNREFNPGDKVLVLLPTSTNKLLASLRGPYPVVRRVHAVNYEVEMADRCKRKCIFHINMLRQLYPPCALSLLAEETTVGVDSDIDEDRMWFCGTLEGGPPTPRRSTRISLRTSR